MFYYIIWGDGYVETWDGPHLSGEDFEISHTYPNEGEFVIEAKVKDINDLESDWTTLNVTMPRSKDVFNSLFFRFLEGFPLLENLFNLYRNILVELNRG